MNTITFSTKAEDIRRSWHIVDVDTMVLGRIATKIALLLTGKAKPYFVRHLDCGDYVVVINAGKIKVTGKKPIQKIYTTYSGYPGGIRREAFRDLIVRKPTEVIRRAVYGMLPKNKLRDRLIKRLFVYADENHPYTDKLKTQNSKLK